MPLYCQTHTVAVYDRGGRRIVGNLESLTRVHYTRLRDDISEALIQITQPSRGCYQLINDISCNRHELVIFRGGERVWEGPITRIARHRDMVEIDAKDIVHYLYRTACHETHDNAAYWVPDEKDTAATFTDNTGLVVDRVHEVLTTELARKEALNPPVNILPHLTRVRAANPANERECNRKTLPYTLSVYDDMEALATYGGLDYVAVGRRLIISDNRVPIGQTPTISENDIMSEVVVTSYGMESFTRAFVSGDVDQNGNIMAGIYPPLGGTGDLTADEIAAIDYYGEWENVEQMFDEDSTESPTQNSLDNAAELNMSGRLPVPTLVRIPENSRLNPNGVLSLEDLVPGVLVPVRANLNSIVITQYQKLDSVTVEETGEDGESISITLGAVPATLLVRGEVQVG